MWKRPLKVVKTLLETIQNSIFSLMGKGESIFPYFGWVFLYVWTSWTTDKTPRRSNGDVEHLIRLSECEKGHWKLSKCHQKQFKVQISFLNFYDFSSFLLICLYFLTSFFQIFDLYKTSRRSMVIWSIFKGSKDVK